MFHYASSNFSPEPFDTLIVERFEILEFLK